MQKVTLGCFDVVIDFAIHRPTEWKVTEVTAPVFSRVYYIAGGDVTYSDENGSMKLKMGHLYFFPTTIPYKMEQNVRDRFFCMFLHIDLTPWVVNSVIDVDVEKDPFMKGLLQAMWQAIESGGKKWEIMDHLSEAAVLHMKNAGRITPSFPALKKAVEYIAENFSREITIKNLSGLCGYHPKYFIRVFKECYGIAPHKYIVNYRLRHSCNILKSGVPVTETAFLCGYGDPKSFCRAFRQKFGVSPKAYREMNTPGSSYEGFGV